MKILWIILLGAVINSASACTQVFVVLPECIDFDVSGACPEGILPESLQGLNPTCVKTLYDCVHQLAEGGCCYLMGSEYTLDESQIPDELGAYLIIRYPGIVFEPWFDGVIECSADSDTWMQTDSAFSRINFGSSFEFESEESTTEPVYEESKRNLDHVVEHVDSTADLKVKVETLERNFAQRNYHQQQQLLGDEKQFQRRSVNILAKYGILVSASHVVIRNLHLHAENLLGTIRVTDSDTICDEYLDPFFSLTSSYSDNSDFFGTSAYPDDDIDDDGTTSSSSSSVNNVRTHGFFMDSSLGGDSGIEFFYDEHDSETSMSSSSSSSSSSYSSSLSSLSTENTVLPTESIRSHGFFMDSSGGLGDSGLEAVYVETISDDVIEERFFMDSSGGGQSEPFLEEGNLPSLSIGSSINETDPFLQRYFLDSSGGGQSEPFINDNNDNGEIVNSTTGSLSTDSSGETQIPHVSSSSASRPLRSSSSSSSRSSALPSSTFSSSEGELIDACVGCAETCTTPIACPSTPNMALDQCDAFIETIDMNLKLCTESTCTYVFRGALAGTKCRESASSSTTSSSDLGDYPEMDEPVSYCQLMADLCWLNSGTPCLHLISESCGEDDTTLSCVFGMRDCPRPVRDAPQQPQQQPGARKLLSMNSPTLLEGVHIHNVIFTGQVSSAYIVVAGELALKDFTVDESCFSLAFGIDQVLFVLKGSLSDVSNVLLAPNNWGYNGQGFIGDYSEVPIDFFEVQSTPFYETCSDGALLSGRKFIPTSGTTPTIMATTTTTTSDDSSSSSDSAAYDYSSSFQSTSLSESEDRKRDLQYNKRSTSSSYKALDGGNTGSTSSDQPQPETALSKTSKSVNHQNHNKKHSSSGGGDDDDDNNSDSSQQTAIIVILAIGIVLLLLSMIFIVLCFSARGI